MQKIRQPGKGLDWASVAREQWQGMGEGWLPGQGSQDSSSVAEPCRRSLAGWRALRPLENVPSLLL